MTTTATAVTITAPAVTVSRPTTETDFSSIVTVTARWALNLQKRALTTKAQPTYATACVAPTEYSSACSCWGVSTRTLTAATPTVTSTVTVTPLATFIPSVTVFPTVTQPFTSTVLAPLTGQPPGACPNPATCGIINFCDNPPCQCRATIEGVNICYNPTLGCGKPCSSSAECGPLTVCLTSTCCPLLPGKGVCIDIGDCRGPAPVVDTFQARDLGLLES